MKKTLCISFMAVMIMASCQQKPKTPTVEREAAKKAVSAILDNYHSGMTSKDANVMIPLLADDGLYCGTDSKEFLDKSTLDGEMRKMFADTAVRMSYSLEKREIRITADGNSAIAVDQFFINYLSPKIPVRWVFHLAKTGDKWLIDFFSLSLIPNNADLGKLNKAME